MKITIPHIHKIEGEAGFWARVTKEGKVKELKLEVLKGLRQIEGILIGRRFWEAPLVVSRVCGICPVVHLLNSCRALEKALNVQVSNRTILLRKLMLAAQIIQSHALHLFFMSLPDFFNIENDLNLIKKFPKETKAALKIRDFSLKIVKLIGGRAVHPMTPKVGGFSKVPEKKKILDLSKDLKDALKSAGILISLLEKIDYPEFQRKTQFVSLFGKENYAFYQNPFVKVSREKISIGDFYSNQIEEDLKMPPVKKTKYKGKPYMLGAIARVNNNRTFLNPQAKTLFEHFLETRKLKEEEFFSNIFYNLFCQMVEILHFLEETEKIIKDLSKEDFQEEPKDFKIKKGSGLSAMEAPRGTLFTYFELDNRGRIFNCNIVTPTAQFLNNLEADLTTYLPNILSVSKKLRIRKIRSLIRVYDPCISCAIH